MIPGMNPRKVQQMMKQMGIQQVDVPATVVFQRARAHVGGDADAAAGAYLHDGRA